jgi:DNA (cytosine-5)-methyltransferase 1
MKVISLFSGAGGLDLGFKKSGFEISWANEYDKSIWDTFKANFKETYLDTRSIVNISSDEVPDNIIGIVGGPPCQSWSEAGAGRGFDDKRGQVFLDYIRILRDKQPLFFLAENVSGMLSIRHKNAFNEILNQFSEAGYSVSYKLLNANDFNVPEDRVRVIFVGFRNDLNKKYIFPDPQNYKPTLRDSIWDLRDTAVGMKNGDTHGESLSIPNHEFLLGGFSSIYMSRNRVRSWDEPSFTIQAGARHAPLHPQAPKMKLIDKNKRIFVEGQEHLYRRLSVRECARIQTFPDNFIFKYKNISDGYKMIGNAVAVNFASALATSIKNQLL